MTKEQIGAVLKKARITSGKTQKEVAELIGRTQQIIGHWETGYSQPDANTLFTLCDIYGTSVDDAFGFNKNSVSIEDLDFLNTYKNLDDYGKETIDIALKRETERVKRIRELEELNKKLNTEFSSEITPMRVMAYYQKLASAGKGEYLFDGVPTDLIEVSDTETAKEADFVLGVNGRSMEPTFHDGEKVFVKKMGEIPTGTIGVFTKGNECYIKELGADGLISHNEDKDTYPDIPASEDILLVGKVLGKVDED